MSDDSLLPVAPEPCLSMQEEEEPKTTVSTLLDPIDDSALFPVSVCGDSDDDNDSNVVCEPAIPLSTDDIPETEFGEFLLDAVAWL